MKKVFVFVSIIFCAILFYSFYVTPKTLSFENRLLNSFKNLSFGEFYVSLANPTVAFVRVQEGMRKEQIAEMMFDRFNWQEKDKTDFFAYDEIRNRKYEGRYFPDVYLIPKNVSGKEMRERMEERFDDKLSKLKEEANKKNLNFDSILIMASIIQREAGGKNDMKTISGVIWNRLFAGMNLQMDATLQYAKGNEENGWWPIVSPKDKTIKSPYNTYQNTGLPPAPIANPGLASVSAALNPQKTSCLFYFHKNRQIYCSKTYAEHKQKIDDILK